MTALQMKHLARVIEKYNCFATVIQHETHYHDQEGTSISWELEVTPSDKHGIYDLMTLRIFDYFLFDYDEHLHNPDDPKDISDYLTIYLKGAGRKDVGTVRIGKDFIEINRNFSRLFLKNTIIYICR